MYITILIFPTKPVFLNHWTEPAVLLDSNSHAKGITQFLKKVPLFLFPFCQQIGGGHNTNAVMAEVVLNTIKEGRQLRTQPFNEYRKRFNLKPYTSFRQFTGKKHSFVYTPSSMRNFKERDLQHL